MRFSLTFLLSLCACSTALAQNVGDKVFTIEKAELKGGTEVVGKTEFGDLLEIEDISGKWFLVNNKGTRGWISRDKVALPDQAIEEFTRQIEADPNNARNYHMRATAKYHKGETEEAIADWTEAIRHRPLAEYYYNRGSVRTEKGDYDFAIADFDQAIESDPRRPYFYASRGMAWNAKGDYDKAIADFDHAILLHPTFVIAINARGNAWQSKREFEKAIADYDQALSLNPRFAFAYNNRGNTWKLMKKYDKAIADYTEAIRLAPKYADAYSNRGTEWKDKGEYDKALADFDEAVRLNPSDADAYNSRAWIMATCPQELFRNGKQAVSDATLACELTDWNDAHKVSTLAAAYAETGDFTKAVKWQQKALDLTPAGQMTDYRTRLDLYRIGKPYRDRLGQ